MGHQFLYNQESDLVMALNDQNPRALKQLYAIYSTALYGVINRITQNAEISKGVLRVCFIEVWNNSCMFNPDKGNLFIWLMNIARNLAIKKIREAPSNGSRYKLLESSSIFNDYKAIIPYDTDKPDIKRYVSELDPKLAIVFNIIYFRCYSYEEAADLLKLAIGTVKTRMRRAIIELRKIYQID